MSRFKPHCNTSVECENYFFLDTEQVTFKFNFLRMHMHKSFSCFHQSIIYRWGVCFTGLDKMSGPWGWLNIFYIMFPKCFLIDWKTMITDETRQLIKGSLQTRVHWEDYLIRKQYCDWIPQKQYQNTCSCNEHVDLVSWCSLYVLIFIIFRSAESPGPKCR